MGSRWDSHSPSHWRVHGDRLLAEPGQGVQYRSGPSTERTQSPHGYSNVQARWCVGVIAALKVHPQGIAVEGGLHADNRVALQANEVGAKIELATAY